MITMIVSRDSKMWLIWENDCVDEKKVQKGGKKKGFKLLISCSLGAK